MKAKAQLVNRHETDPIEKKGRQSILNVSGDMVPVTLGSYQQAPIIGNAVLAVKDDGVYAEIEVTDPAAIKRLLAGGEFFPSLSGIVIGAPGPKKIRWDSLAVTPGENTDPNIQAIQIQL